MALNSRKHTIPSGADQSVSRATIFETFGNSIHDVIPVANATERAQVIADLTAAGVGPSAGNPVVVARGDAPGLHRVEYTYDGTVWIPSSGLLRFPDDGSADSWATANGALLAVGDRAIIGGRGMLWTGTEWVDELGDTGEIPITVFNNGFASSTTSSEVVRIQRISGVTYLMGGLMRATAPTTGAIAFGVPPGFRPKSQVRVPMRQDLSMHVIVETNGAVTIQSSQAQPGPTGAGWSLNGISFVAAPS